MAKSILTPDMVSIGLLISGGNIDITLGTLMERIMEFQVVNHRIFGESDEDYQNACIFLAIFESQSLRCKPDIAEFNRLRFRDIIPEMLLYHEVYMNDEGDHWTEDINYKDRQLERFFGLDRKEYQKKMELRQAMRDFFTCSREETDIRGMVSAFMEEHGITREMLINLANY
jgi:hypothetical protein